MHAGYSLDAAEAARTERSNGEDLRCPQRTHDAPICFQVISATGSTSFAELRSLRQQLSDAVEEAQMNWQEFMHVREESQALKEELESQRNDNARLSNRLRRFRNRVGDVLRARQQLSNWAQRTRDAEHRTVQALIHEANADTNTSISSVRQALDFAATHMLALSIPSEVAENAASLLDRSGKQAARGKKVRAALIALHSYAIDPERGHDFKSWCANSGHPAVLNANTVALSESQNVQQRPVMSDQRKFKVDPTLDLSGRREMQAHIRIAQGDSAPRLYFFDDTRGETGKIHIGYIGPHLDTARDPT